MRDTILAGLTAFFVEHQYCGELDGGRDNGSIWLQCSCGAHITHPASIPRADSGRPSKAANHQLAGLDAEDTQDPGR